MTDTERVSVIIPTYNRAHTIARAIDSLLTQTRPPDEIIVVDDGSNDNTLEVLERYVGKISLIVSPRNEGQPAARNRALDAATGDFIAFLDSDDTLPIDSIERRLNALRQNPDYDVVYGDALFIDAHDQPLEIFSKVRPMLRPSGDVYYPFLQNNLAPVHTFMIRRTPQTSPLRMENDLRMIEDYDYWLKLSEICPFLYIDTVLAHYHIHETMGTATESENMRRKRLIVQRHAIARPRFQQLSPAQQAHIYTQIGASVAAVEGDMRAARALLNQALRLRPTALQARVYWLVTWSGVRGVNALNQVRRAVLKVRGQYFPRVGAS